MDIADFPFPFFRGNVSRGKEDEDGIPFLSPSASSESHEDEGNDSRRCIQESTQQNYHQQQHEPFSDEELSTNQDDSEDDDSSDWERLSLVGYDTSGLLEMEEPQDERESSIVGKLSTKKWPGRRYLTLVFLLSGIVTVMVHILSQTYASAVVIGPKQILAAIEQQSSENCIGNFSVQHEMQALSPVRSSRAAFESRDSNVADKVLLPYYSSRSSDEMKDAKFANSEVPPSAPSRRGVLKRLKRTVGKVFQESSAQHHYASFMGQEKHRYAKLKN